MLGSSSVKKWECSDHGKKAPPKKRTGQAKGLTESDEASCNPQIPGVSLELDVKKGFLVNSVNPLQCELPWHSSAFLDVHLERVHREGAGVFQFLGRA